MTDDEYQFICRRYEVESKSFFKLMNLIMLLGMAFATFIAVAEVWHNAVESNPENKTHIAMPSILIMAAIILIILLLSFFNVLYPYFLDKKEGIKIIDTLFITSKESLPQNNLYMIHTMHPLKPILPVSFSEFNNYNIGDEINFEFAKHSKEFFSYF